MGTRPGGFVAAVGGVAGMMLAQAVFFGGESGHSQGRGQRSSQNQADTLPEKGFVHGFDFLLE